MAIRGETAQFTARIEARMLNAIRKLADREGVSTNEKLNDIVELGLIALVAKRKKGVTTTTPPLSQNA